MFLIVLSQSFSLLKFWPEFVKNTTDILNQLLLAYENPIIAGTGQAIHTPHTHT